MTNEELIVLAKNGDKSAKEKLFEDNYRFNYHIAQKFSNTGIDLNDLVGMCQLGMVKAYNTFDVSKGIKFITYASRIMTNEVLMYLRKHKKIKFEVSLDLPLNHDVDGNELTLVDVLESDSSQDIDNFVTSTALGELVREFSLTLSERDKIIFEATFFDNNRQNELAEQLGLSQSYISRLATKIVNKFRKFAERTGFTKEKGVEEKVKNPRLNSDEFKYVVENYKLSHNDLMKYFKVSSPTISRYKNLLKEGTLPLGRNKVNEYKVLRRLSQLNLGQSVKPEEIIEEVHGKEESASTLDLEAVHETVEVDLELPMEVERKMNQHVPASPTLVNFEVSVSSANRDSVSQLLNTVSSITSGDKVYNIKISVSEDKPVATHNAMFVPVR